MRRSPVRRRAAPVIGLALATAVGLALAAVACGGPPAADGPDDPAVSGDSVIRIGDPTPTDTVYISGDSLEDAVDSTAGTGWTVGVVESSGPPRAVSTLTEVRTGRHDGFDRVVWTFAEARPGWHLEYVDRPVRACGSGETVPLPGDAWLEVRFEFARAHDDEGRLTAAAPGDTPALERVLRVARTCDFEAVVVHVLAVDSPEPFRVIELTDPPRIVVDVRHER